jgi:hypothetical protein
MGPELDWSHPKLSGKTNQPAVRVLGAGPARGNCFDGRECRTQLHSQAPGVSEECRAPLCPAPAAAVCDCLPRWGAGPLAACQQVERIISDAP